MIEQRLTNLGTDDSLYRAIHKNGEEPLVTTIHSLEELKKALEYGPCTLSITSIGGHQIVVDAVTEEGVEVRDPYHGWAVVLKKEAFLRSINGSLSHDFSHGRSIIQILNNKMQQKV